MLNAKLMRQLPHCFNMVPDPRRSQGRCHRLPVVLGIAAGATRCGQSMRGQCKARTPCGFSLGGEVWGTFVGAGNLKRLKK